MNNGFCVGQLRRLYLHHLRRRVRNGSMDQWLLISKWSDRRLILVKKDFRHHVMIHRCVSVQWFLINWRVRQLLRFGHHGLDVLQGLMHCVVVYRRCHRLHICDGRFRYYAGIDGRLLNILQMS